METRIITVTLRGAAAEKLREAQADKPKRVDWTGFSRALDAERRQK